MSIFEKRGQMKLSFGMIFSIILIIVFIAFAFYAINFFINFQEQASSKKLVEDIQKDINTVWKSSESSQTFEYNIPKSVEYLCFIDFVSGKKGINSELYDEIKNPVFSERNFVLYYGKGDSGSESFELEHINLGTITSKENPFCLRKNNGKTSLLLKKDFSDTLVTVERAE